MTGSDKARRRPEATVTSKGQLTLPVDIRRPLDVRTGDRFEIEIVGADEVRMTLRRKRDALELLAALPKLPPGRLGGDARSEAADDALGAKFPAPRRGG